MFNCIPNLDSIFGGVRALLPLETTLPDWQKLLPFETTWPDWRSQANGLNYKHDDVSFVKIAMTHSQGAQSEVEVGKGVNHSFDVQVQKKYLS